jgi:uncharacterized membrane protein (UPF0182 family)
MEATLEQSLSRIFGGRAGPAPVAPQPATAGTAPAPGATPSLAPADRAAIQRAFEAFTRSQEAIRRGDWAAYGAEQKRLEETLRSLSSDRR